MYLPEATMARLRLELSDYIAARNEREGLDTPEKRLDALGARMRAAKAQERRRLAETVAGEAA